MTNLQRKNNMPKIELTQIKTGFTGDYCYTHARGAMLPGNKVVITTQKLMISGTDVFYGLEMLTSSDNGEHWSDIVPQLPLARKNFGNGVEQAFCDATPFYHRASGKLLLTGHDALYLNNKIYPPPRPRHTIWSVFDETAREWSVFRELKMAYEDKYFSCGSGCCQILELDNGELLIPVYYQSRKEAETPNQSTYHAMVMRCSFDGTELRCLEVGNSVTVPVPRGCGEPSITAYNGQYFLALRNDKAGYVSRSDDGLHFSEPELLKFDDGSDSGNYCTQQHWFRCGGKLYIVYTRKGANNDHVFRHRAPLFAAEFDPDRMVIIRESEFIAVPERGARLGNFGCFNVNENEAWIIASEWMQTTAPDPGNWRRCMSYGSDNSIFVAKIRSR